MRKGREELLGVLRGTSPRVALLVGQPAVDDAQACLELASPPLRPTPSLAATPSLAVNPIQP